MKNKLNILLSAFLFTLLIQTSAQAQYNKKDLIGKWKISLEHVVESLPKAQRDEYNKMTDDQKKYTILMLQQMMGEIRWEFKKDGTTKVNLGKGKTQSGKWKMNGDKITLIAEDKNTEMKILKLESKLFRFSSVDNNGKKILLTLVPVE